MTIGFSLLADGQQAANNQQPATSEPLNVEPLNPK
jgi:hypothetical protein